ncbi:hypothetical protein Ae717Ps2_6420 [Pseudonocardia sp. Ae717_Ps2]|nr:hypothetical protein Ae717Ps2_6354 [Pseudonocardia sp. Ae717_Ps2]OLM28479.1 hypothetical protein Ae717Ps2_6375 [Pseudonocardia sp. Ae717_Ps2]OLM28500.1 hypothetical protein Ae717Ps2_6396 [Pseudonocardia sp. Ae717_Ps2]OLM28524.1 hypothetical protein Ae717Ps2_6420 [Pseudonocardia sp. Ae717_Ps2]
MTDQIGMGFCRFSSRVCRRTEWLRGDIDCLRR